MKLHKLQFIAVSLGALFWLQCGASLWVMWAQWNVEMQLSFPTGYIVQNIQNFNGICHIQYVTSVWSTVDSPLKSVALSAGWSAKSSLCMLVPNLHWSDKILMRLHSTQWWWKDRCPCFGMTRNSSWSVPSKLPFSFCVTHCEPLEDGEWDIHVMIHCCPLCQLPIWLPCL